MKIVFMGTPDFAVGALEAIVEAGHQVAAVVTQPDKPKGRGKEMQMTPVKQCALSHGIPVFQPVKIKEPEAVEELRGYGADLFVGDQLFTDVWGAKKAGIRSWLVKPIHPREEIQIVLKRRLEWIVLFFYRRSRGRYCDLR